MRFYAFQITSELPFTCSLKNARASIVLLSFTALCGSLLCWLIYNFNFDGTTVYVAKLQIIQGTFSKLSVEWIVETSQNHSHTAGNNNFCLNWEKYKMVSILFMSRLK